MIDFRLPFSLVVFQDQRPLFRRALLHALLQTPVLQVILIVRRVGRWRGQRLSSLLLSKPFLINLFEHSIEIEDGITVVGRSDLRDLPCYPVDCFVRKVLCFPASTTDKNLNQPSADFLVPLCGTLRLTVEPRKQCVELVLSQCRFFSLLRCRYTRSLPLSVQSVVSRV